MSDKFDAFAKSAQRAGAFFWMAGVGAPPKSLISAGLNWRSGPMELEALAKEVYEIYCDGSWNARSGVVGYGALIKGPDGAPLAAIAEARRANPSERSSTSAERLAMVAGMRLASEFGAKKVRLVSDCQLAAENLQEQSQEKNPGQKKRNNGLMAEMWGLARGFEEFMAIWRPREENKEADALSRMLSRGKFKESEEVLRALAQGKDKAWVESLGWSVRKSALQSKVALKDQAGRWRPNAFCEAETNVSLRGGEEPIRALMRGKTEVSLKLLARAAKAAIMGSIKEMTVKMDASLAPPLGFSECAKKQGGADSLRRAIKEIEEKGGSFALELPSGKLIEPWKQGWVPCEETNALERASKIELEEWLASSDQKLIAWVEKARAKQTPTSPVAFKIDENKGPEAGDQECEAIDRQLQGRARAGFRGMG